MKAGFLGAVFAACFSFATLPSHADLFPEEPIVKISAVDRILNEIGERLPGNWNSPPDERALVHILGADNGIFPPMPDGSPHPENPILEGGVTGIGNMIYFENTGFFEVWITNNVPEPGTNFFARAYNRSTTEESLFYGDSQIMTVGESPDDDNYYYPRITATDQIVNSERDTDNDGLPDWWEWLYFRNITNAVPDEDYDGSGMTNWEEHIAGTDPTDPLSFLGITRVDVRDDGGVLVEWLSVPGRRYRVQFRDSGLTESDGFRYVTGDFIASSDLSHAIIPESEGMDVDRGYFRVRVFRAE